MMNRPKPLPLFVLLLTLGVLLFACSDSKSPTGPSIACGDANVDCLTQSFGASDWAQNASYYAPGDVTNFTGGTALSAPNFSDVSPGDQVHIQLSFSPPLVVTSNVPSQVTLMLEGTNGTSSYDEYVYAPHTFRIRGSWPDPSGTRVAINGIRKTGEIVELRIDWRPTGFSEGDELRGLTVDFTMPSAWSDGVDIGDKQPLPIEVLTWIVKFDGDHSGDTPPIQVGN